MSIEPRNVWENLSPQCQIQITAELTAIIQEVIHDYLRTHHACPPDAQSPDLHQP